MNSRGFPPHTNQRGAAVVTAMLVVAIAATLVSGTFYRQSVVARTLENTASASQVRWLMAGAIDWVKVILREDARASSVDHLGEPWAVTLAQTRLNQGDEDPAWLSGKIEDAQSRFNLRNVVSPKGVVRSEVNALSRLLVLTGENAFIGERIAQVLQAQLVGPRAGPLDMLPASIDDLTFSEERLVGAMEKLRPFVTLLPEPTPINVNTASAQVLAARFDGMTLSDARRLISSRSQASFKDLADVSVRLTDTDLDLQSERAGVTSRFFTLDGTVEYQNSRLRQRALLRRDAGRVELMWRAEVYK